jgi:hypothetical protein
VVSSSSPNILSKAFKPLIYIFLFTPDNLMASVWKINHCYIKLTNNVPHFDH